MLRPACWSRSSCAVSKAPRRGGDGTKFETDRNRCLPCWSPPTGLCPVWNGPFVAGPHSVSPPDPRSMRINAASDFLLWGGGQGCGLILWDVVLTVSEPSVDCVPRIRRMFGGGGGLGCPGGHGAGRTPPAGWRNGPLGRKGPLRTEEGKRRAVGKEEKRRADPCETGQM